jgi:hypothetical protein
MFNRPITIILEASSDFATCDEIGTVFGGEEKWRVVGFVLFEGFG